MKPNCFRKPLILLIGSVMPDRSRVHKTMEVSSDLNVERYMMGGGGGGIMGGSPTNIIYGEGHEKNVQGHWIGHPTSASAAGDLC